MPGHASQWTDVTDRRPPWVLAGVLAGVAGLATSYATANVLSIRESPVVAVAESVIKLTPARPPSGRSRCWATTTSPRWSRASSSSCSAASPRPACSREVAGGARCSCGSRSPRWGSLAVLSLPSSGGTDVLPIARRAGHLGRRALGPRRRAAPRAPATRPGVARAPRLPDGRRRGGGWRRWASRSPVVSWAPVGARSSRAAGCCGSPASPGASRPPPRRSGCRASRRGRRPTRTSTGSTPPSRCRRSRPRTGRCASTGSSTASSTLSYSDLVAREMTESWITLNCVSNEVGGGLVGNVRWSGVRIADLLADLGVIRRRRLRLPDLARRLVLRDAAGRADRRPRRDARRRDERSPAPHRARLPGPHRRPRALRLRLGDQVGRGHGGHHLRQGGRLLDDQGLVGRGAGQDRLAHRRAALGGRRRPPARSRSAASPGTSTPASRPWRCRSTAARGSAPSSARCRRSTRGCSGR